MQHPVMTAFSQMTTSFADVITLQYRNSAAQLLIACCQQQVLLHDANIWGSATSAIVP